MSFLKLFLLLPKQAEWMLKIGLDFDEGWGIERLVFIVEGIAQLITYATGISNLLVDIPMGMTVNPLVNSTIGNIIA